MLFGSTNALDFYTATIQALHKKWLFIFSDTKYLICVTSAPITIICNDKIIIDDILLYTNNVLTLLHYFSCVTQVFTKYRLSFKLTKCELFTSHVKCV